MRRVVNLDLIQPSSRLYQIVHILVHMNAYLICPDISITFCHNSLPWQPFAMAGRYRYSLGRSTMISHISLAFNVSFQKCLG